MSTRLHLLKDDLYRIACLVVDFVWNGYSRLSRFPYDVRTETGKVENAHSWEMFYQTVYFNWTILLHETTLFQELCTPILARNHTFPINVCPTCTKPYFSANTPKAARVDTWTTSEICPPSWSRTQRTQGRNIPFRVTPHSDFSDLGEYETVNTRARIQGNQATMYGRPALNPQQ